jgi:TatD DNase family protein
LVLEIIDTHSHLDMPEFDNDREDVIRNALDAGVKTIITVGINPESNLRAVKLAEEHSNIFACIGIHPQDAQGTTREDIQQLIQLARHPRVVGIGELGLDFFREHSPRVDQLQVLDWELEAAKITGKPIVIHCRQAQEAFLPILEKWCSGYPQPVDQPRGVLHCFSGDAALAQKYIDLGFYLSIGAYLGYPSSAQLRENVKIIDLNRILIETDCPFLPPQKKRGQRNEPAYAAVTAGILAEIKGLSIEEVGKITSDNASRVFKIS